MSSYVGFTNGTMVALRGEVDNLVLDGNTLSSGSGAINITPVAGSAIALDTTTTVDGGVIANTGTITNTGASTTNTLPTAASTSLVAAVHTDNTSATSHALIRATAGGASGGDPLFTATVTGATSWSFGVDNSASDAFVVSEGTALGTTDSLSLATSGGVTVPRGNLTVSAGTVSVASTAAGILSTWTSTDAGATSGPTLDLYRNSASPAPSDAMGTVQFNGRDSAGNKTQYCEILGTIVTTTDTLEDGQLIFNTIVAGATTNVMTVGATAITNNLPTTITGAGLTPLTTTSTDAGAAAGPLFDIYRNSASAANSDGLGGFNFTGNSSTGVKRTYAAVNTNIVTATNGAEDGNITLATMAAGTLAVRFTLANASSTLEVPLTITGAGLTPLIVQSTDAGAAAGPNLQLDRFSASPANADVLGSLIFVGRSSTAVARPYATIVGNAVTVTNAAENGSMDFQVEVSGTSTTVMTLANASGTINVPTTITGSGVAPLTVTSTDAGAAASVVNLYRNSASPLANDVLSALRFTGQDATPATVTYGQINCDIVAATAGASSGALVFQTENAGTVSERFRVGNLTTTATGSTLTNTFATAGSTGTITSIQTDNTNGASHALVSAVSGGASGGDAVFTGTITGATSWSWGVDNTDSDAFVLSEGTALGTTNSLRAPTGGGITVPRGDLAVSAGVLTIATTGIAPLTITSTDAGASGAVVDLYRNSASPLAGDFISSIDFYGQDAAPAKVLYSQIVSRITATTAGAANGNLRIAALSGGVNTIQIDVLNTGCQVRGNNTNTAAPAGFIGEVLSTNTASPGTSLTTTVVANVNNVTLTPGNWMITGLVAFNPAATTTVTGMFASINTASATLGTRVTGFSQYNSTGTINTGGGFDLDVPITFVSIASNTIYYLNAQANFAVDTCTAFGRIQAVRIG